ncbi:hypothetical protein PILCRDRAFT_822481 [Piloderma croceum F 1598]|uniref:Extracellular membrane protein CFEM domain-containing protein n=1 Tax=Piloderma croceum (strain F 1598) TaxID=765440 RepID=A0A0C3FK99_PILCF|nr:hypothetical protein PILCRDRAFT_822481 [Piloderma croceum F 1598]
MPLLLPVLVLLHSLSILRAASSLGIIDAPGMKELRECALLGLGISIYERCSTDGCVCESQDLPLILDAVSTAVDIQCSTNSYDATAAMAAVVSYCTIRSFTIPSALASMTALPGNNRPFSLYDTPEYTELPICAQNPFIEGCDSLDCRTNDCFCRPDLMARAMDSVRRGASAACSGVAPAGVNSALAAIKSYCSRNGFTVATLSNKATGTSVLPSSTALAPGAYSSIVQATRSASSMVPSASNSVRPSIDSSSSKYLDAILPATISVVLVLVAAIWLFLRFRRKSVQTNDPQVVAIDSPDRTSVAFFPHAQHVVTPNSTFIFIGGNQNNIQSNQSNSSFD